MKRGASKAVQMQESTTLNKEDNRVPSADTLEQILRCMMKENEKYKTLHFNHVDVMLRLSTARRRKDETLDVDIVQIATNPVQSGIGTMFLLNLMHAADAIGRGVFLEQTITIESRGWAQKLVKAGTMQRYHVEDNFISIRKGDLIVPSAKHLA